MTQLLISVTSLDEAQMALENGADIIDLKDPSAGALGALPVELITSIVSFVNKQKLTSATIGDQPMQPDLLVQHVNAVAKTGVDYIKIGFFESCDYQPCLDALACITHRGVKLIAVLFAEYRYPNGLIDAIKNAGFIGVMLDTAKKNGLTFMDYYSNEQRAAFAQQVLTTGLTFGLAGSLKSQDIAMLNSLNPTYLGFRGGVCENNQREQRLNGEKIRFTRNGLQFVA